MIVPKLLRRLRWILSVASDIVPKLPSRADSPLIIAVKTLAIADSLNRGRARGNDIHNFFEKLDADTATNAQFVELFFSTPMKSIFNVERTHITDYADIVVAQHDAIGTLYFIEYRFGNRPEPASDFWFSPGFDFRKALSCLWAHFDKAIHMGIEVRGDKVRTTYGPIQPPSSPISNNGLDRVDELVARHNIYQARKLRRSYLFVGKQGVGKSTAALSFSLRCGSRVLRIDAQGMTAVGTNDLCLILEGLQPDFLIIDDIDKAAAMQAALPTLLATLCDLKNRSHVTIVMTANTVATLDPSFVRPGRVDEILEFETPERGERLAIIAGELDALSALGALQRPEFAEELADATEGLTAAYLREVGVQLAVSPGRDVLKTIVQMKRIAEQAKGGAPDAPPGAPQPTAPRTAS